MEELNGFIKLFRKIRRWEWYKEPIVKSVFLECLLLATYKEASWMGTKLKPGQLITSYASLSENLGISVQKVRTAIKKLQKTNEIFVKATNKYTLITIVKWGDYQEFDVNVNNQITNKWQSNNIQPTINQQHLKNIKNKENIKKSTYVSAYPNVVNLKDLYEESLKEKN